MEKSKTAKEAEVAKGKPASTKGNGTILIVSALDMSWRLVIVVLVPIIGGYELDKHLNSSPALTIIGFLLAMGGLFYILKRTLALADQKFKTKAQR